MEGLLVVSYTMQLHHCYYHVGQAHRQCEGLTDEERGDRCWKFLATLVEDLERNAALRGHPNETGKRLGYSSKEIQEYVEYWVSLRRLKRATTPGKVSITGEAIMDVRAPE
jgi:hypothetical protein